ncbi:MAG: tilS [Enterovirga sp.]|nr:tilS [Enterovirga sp.]
MTLPLDAAAFAAIFKGLEDAGTILLAVSGGPDSTAMMHGVARWAAARGRPALQVATVDHQIRSASRFEAEAVGDAAARLGLPHAVLPWTDRRGATSQEAARRARYRLLTDHAAVVGATHLLTAHTVDDQAETLMLRLAAGTGMAGLAGMRRETRRTGLRHVRPFLSVPKRLLVETCRAEGWAFVEDPSNADAAYGRTRWRTLMPLLAAEGLDAPRLGRLAERVARAEEALDRTAHAASARMQVALGPGRIDMAALSREPEEIALRVLRAAVEDAQERNRSTLGEGAPPALRLERAEACLAALLGARTAGQPLRRTLAGLALDMDRFGCVTIRPEGARRRGRSGSVTATEGNGTRSLGIGGARP